MNKDMHPLDRVGGDHSMKFGIITARKSSKEEMPSRARRPELSVGSQGVDSLDDAVQRP